MQSELLQAALSYTDRGFSVIPIQGDKRPFIKWEPYQTKRATPEEIRQWWQRWPGAMIGIVTGEITGILVIDCDTLEGYEAIQRLLPDSIILPIARTPRGGWHLWFIYPKGSGITVGTGIMPGVDYRGEGGYIIAPPSINDAGKRYAWQEGLALGEVEPAAAPAALYNILNNSLYRGDVVNEVCRKPQMTTRTTKDHKFFHQGHRDESLFHAAYCLIKGGGELPFTEQVIDILARNCNPPFPENEIRAKIDSALKRVESRERNLTSEIREWVLTTKGHFKTTEVHKELQLTTSREQKTCYMVLSRLCEGPNPLIERYGNKRGCYRRIENDIEPVDFMNAPTDEFPITWPMGVDDLCSIYPGSIIMVAGSKSAGKTAFLLNVVRENMHRHEVVYLNSEMGDTEFRKRLELFDCMPLHDWKFKAYHRASNFADLISPERKIFIVDFLEVTTDFWKVGGMIQEIHRKLRDGIAIIALQKADGKDTGRGGDFSKEKARLYLSLDYIHDQKVNRIKVTDAKAWRSERNPRGLWRHYKLVRGSLFVPVTDWRD
ncbi:MAG TPA: bifunctional DNA primase/polymerase [Smithellaceae bacterium]|nr:bifunctional DNA primase/polymerase [Smithellaceae bacterium]